MGKFHTIKSSTLVLFLMIVCFFTVKAANVYAQNSSNWQLPKGNYEGYFDLAVVYPRPDNETPAWARHRHAHPGIKYEIPIGIQFGKWPYRYEKITGPDWLNIVNETLVWDGVDKFIIPSGYGILAGIAPDILQAHELVTVRVYDQDHNRPNPSYIDVSFSVEVNSGNFVFVDTLNGDDQIGDGSINNPYREITRPATSGNHANKIVVIRQTRELDADDNSSEYNPNNTWSGGYIPNTESVGIFPVNPGKDPMSFINYPGETVHINLKNRDRYATVQNDMFFSGVTLAYTHQVPRTLGNVRVISGYDSKKRVTFWQLKFYRPFGGTLKNDNHGAVYFNANGNPNVDSGHAYIYFADNEGDRLNYDPHEGAAFSGTGSNGAHLFETYTTSRTLVERNKVKNSQIINNLFIGPKGESDKYEVRANDTTENNIGTHHIRMAGYGMNYQERGYHRNTVFCYNKSGNLTNITATIETGNTSLPDPNYHWGIYVYRNSMPGTMSRVTEHYPQVPFAFNNIVGSINPNSYNEAGNVFMSTSIDLFATVDNEMNLIGEARNNYLGRKGAELSNLTEYLLSDINKDGRVNIFDYNIFLGEFGKVNECGNTADINEDCNINIFDYNLLIGEFGN